MSQMDDIEAAIAGNEALQKAVEQAGKTLQDAKVTLENSSDNQATDNNNSSELNSVEAAIANNEGLQKAAEQEGQTLQAAKVTQENSNESQVTDSNNDANTNSDSAEMYRSLDSDVGNMNGKQISDSGVENNSIDDSVVAERGGNEKSTQMDQHAESHPNIPDDVKQEAKESIVDGVDAKQSENAMGETGQLTPSETPAIDKGGNDGQER